MQPVNFIVQISGTAAANQMEALAGTAYGKAHSHVIRALHKMERRLAVATLHGRSQGAGLYEQPKAVL